jgi:hypothetical protein
MGALEQILMSEGYQIQYCDIGEQNLKSIDPTAAELMVVLGAPIGNFSLSFLCQEIGFSPVDLTEAGRKSPLQYLENIRCSTGTVTPSACQRTQNFSLQQQSVEIRPSHMDPIC